MTDQTTQNQKMARHENTMIRPAPIDGANTGAMTKTAMIWDMALAIRVPSKLSRIIAVATTREPAAPTPQTNREMSSQFRLGENADPMAPATDTAMPA